MLNFIFISAIALISSLAILPAMDMRKAKPVYVIEIEALRTGDQVILNGCITVTNDAGYNVGWGIAIKELYSNTIISPRQTRNVTPDMHHDSNSVMCIYTIPQDGTYKFALVVWCGSSRANGKRLTVEKNNYGQLVVQVLAKE